MKGIISSYLHKKNAIALLVSALLFSTTIVGQCTNGTGSNSAFTPNYSGNLETIQSISAAHYAKVNILPNKYYTFVSTLQNQASNGYTGFITITNEDGSLVLANGYGSSPLFWESSANTGVIRYYIHTSANCGSSVAQYNYSIVSYNSLCAAPTNLTTTNITNNSATLNWTPPVSAPANGYQYYISQTSTPPLNSDSTPPTGYSLTSSKVVNNLNQNTTYYWWVRSSCGTQNTIWIYYGAFTTAATICNQPSNLSISAITGNSALLSWTAPSPTPSDGYQYYYNTTGTTPNNAFDTNNTSVTLNSLQPNTTYYYWVKSVCGFNIFSPWLFGGSFTTLNGQFCNVATYGLHPAATFTPACTGTAENIAIDAYAGEYSNVAITANTNYTFSSSVATDYITLTSQDGNTLLTKGTTPLSWNSGTNSGVIRYYFHKSAACDSENIDRTRSITCSSSASCLPPSSLSSFDVGSSSASISWTASASNPSLYDVYLSTSATAPTAGTTPIGNIDATAATINNLSPSTTYYFWVRSDCGALKSVWVSGGSFTTTGASCSAPSNITKSNITSSTAQINWSAATPSPASGYQFYYSTSNSAPTGATTPSGSTALTNTTLNGLSPSTTYYIWVRSNCGSATSSWVSGGSFTTTAAVCNPPSNLISFGVTSNSAGISWTAAVPAPEEYDVYFSTSSVAPNAGTIPIGSVSGVSATLIELSANTTYYFWVRSDCTASQSAWSAVGTFTTLVAVPGCTNASFGQFPDATFTPSCDGSDELIVLNAYAGEYALVNVVASRQYTFQSDVETDYITITNQNATVTYAYGTTPLVWNSGSNSGVIRYYFHTDAACGEQNQDRGRYIRCQTPPPCNAPAGVWVTNVTTNGAQLGWATAFPQPSNGYQYYVSTSATVPTAATVPTGTAATNSAVLSALQPQTTYYFWVRSNCGGTPGVWTTTAGTFTTAAQPLPGCTEAPYGEFPSSAFTPNCTGSNQTIVSNAYAGEYSRVNVVANRQYTFSSSVATDYVTIMDVNATTTLAHGASPLLWDSGSTAGTIRYYLHTNASCGVEDVDRIRYISCAATLGEADVEMTSLEWHPNPVKDRLYLSHDVVIDEVEVVNVLGQTVKTERPKQPSVAIDFTDVAKGVYLVKAVSEGRVKTFRIVKE